MSTVQSGGDERRDDDAGAGGEDRLSALPDDVLVLILLILGTKKAAQTSILSRRWRRVWTLLPELHFDGVEDPQYLPSAVSAGDVPLHTLLVGYVDASPQSLVAWLPAAARRVSGNLVLGEYTCRRKEADLSQRGTFDFELPCFEKATSIVINLGFLGISLPPAGVFARLTELKLTRVRFHGPGELGNAVSSPRCPCLQELKIDDVRGLDNITIDSESLQLLDLRNINDIEQVTVVAPALNYFTLVDCFIHGEKQPVVNISAPQLERLRWEDAYDPSTVDLGGVEHLQTISAFFCVYGIDDFSLNHACLMLLPQFKTIENLVLSLFYLPEVEDLQYLMEDMTILPDVTTLRLIVEAKGHAFGPCSFHVLRICSGIKQLVLDLSSWSHLKEQTECSSDCICDEPTNWKTEELLLNHLQELKIEGFGGEGPEIAFVKPLLNWVTVLKTMTVTFSQSVTESKAKELFEMFKSSCRPGICMEFYIYQNFRLVPYAPEG